MSDSFKLIKKIVSKESHWKLELLNSWRELTFHSSTRITIEAILDKTLVLGVCHPAIAQQLSMSAKQILATLKEKVPGCKIERLAFKTVDQEAEPNKEPIETKEPIQQQLSIGTRLDIYSDEPHLTEKELQSLDTVYCQRLKQLLQKFYARCKRKEAIYATRTTTSQPQAPLGHNSLASIFGLVQVGV